jgi:cytidylate kinase
VTPVIAIDGPAAAGKGTLARRLAAHFGLPHLDTGLLYRAVGRRVLDAGGDPHAAAVAEAAARVLIAADLDRPDLRDMDTAAAASAVAAHPGVRAALLAFQRDFAARGAVLDGRDIGTVIVPDAAVKLYVTASMQARGMRRYRELADRGQVADLAAITADLAARDAADAARAAAPMKPAEDAILIDTTELDPDQAFVVALAAAEPRLARARQA